MCHERREDQPPLKSAFTTTLARRSVASWNERTNDSAIASSSSGNRWPYWFERHVDRRVAHAGLNRFRVGTGRNGERHTRVSEIVESA